MGFRRTAYRNYAFELNLHMYVMLALSRVERLNLSNSILVSGLSPRRLLLFKTIWGLFFPFFELWLLSLEISILG